MKSISIITKTRQYIKITHEINILNIRLKYTSKKEVTPQKVKVDDVTLTRYVTLQHNKTTNNEQRQTTTNDN